MTAFCVSALRSAGLNETDARITAEVLVTTDTWGVFTHGVKNLRGYIRRLRGGGLRAAARPTVTREGLAWALVDGDSAIGMVASVFAMRTAIAKARTAGFAYAGLRNSCHFGAAGYYASLALEEGMIGIAMCNDTPTVTVPGARGAVLGSNPLAYAIPAGPEKPLLLDMATSTVAGGKVFAAAALGKPIPENWIVDGRGLPTSDPSRFPHEGALTPMAGHKGYGIALLIETLSAVLSGASMAQHVLSWTFGDASLPTDHGAAFIAVDIGAMMPREEFEARMAQTIREIRKAPRAEGAERIYLPGEMEWERREKALVEGIEFPPDVVANLKLLAEEMGADLDSLARK